MSWWELKKGDVETLGDIQAKCTREDDPKFSRIYKVRLDDRAAMEITFRNAYYGNGRDASGELTQPNGRWVSFDPDRPADKILDPRLIPPIEERYAEIKRLDREWFGNGPTEFVDERGRKWVLA